MLVGLKKITFVDCELYISTTAKRLTGNHSISNSYDYFQGCSVVKYFILIWRFSLCSKVVLYETYQVIQLIFD